MKVNTKQFVTTDTRPDRASDLSFDPQASPGGYSALRHAGFSLIEMLVVIGIIALLVAVAIPSINAMEKSIDSTGALSMVEAALSTARALAISNREYVGVRFQKAADANAVGVEDDPINRNQYMIIIIQQEYRKSNDKDIFETLKGHKPIKLPENMGLMDLADITAISTDADITNATTFSIVFSPAGKLLKMGTQTRNYDGTTGNSSMDDIFNTEAQIKAGIGMFLQDPNPAEKSRTKFRIYNRKVFNEEFNAGTAYNYASTLKTHMINPYTGRVIQD